MHVASFILNDCTQSFSTFLDVILEIRGVINSFYSLSSGKICMHLRFY